MLSYEFDFCFFRTVFEFHLWFAHQCSHDENFAYLNHPDDGTTAVTLGNPKTIEFQVVRTSLLPGLLKSLSHNKDLPLPIKIFEVSDVVVKDPAKDVGARNKRRLCAVYCNSTDSFEVPRVSCPNMRVGLIVQQR